MRWLHLIWIALIVLSGSMAVYAQSDTLSPSEMAQATEARHLLTTYAGEVWVGWGDAVPPMLLRKGNYDYWIGSPEPAAPFVVMPDIMIDGERVYRAEGHQVPVPAATSWQVGDQWVVAIPVRDEFQAAIDQAVGEGAIVLDDAAYVRSIVHESFHAYHLATFGGFEQMPDFTQAADDTWLDRLTDAERTALDEALLAEGRALAEALEPDATDSEIRSAIDEFLRLRTERRAALPDEAATFERGTEWIEGAARYADISLMQQAGPTEIWEQFREAVADLSLVPGGYRDRFYELGAAQMFVLDRLLPGWQTRLWDDGMAVEDLLAEEGETHNGTRRTGKNRLHQRQSQGKSSPAYN